MKENEMCPEVLRKCVFLQKQPKFQGRVGLIVITIAETKIKLCFMKRIACNLRNPGIF